MERIRRRLARVRALMDGRALEPADDLWALRLILEVQDAGLEIIERPGPLQLPGWRREVARMTLAEHEIAEAVRSAFTPAEFAA